MSRKTVPKMSLSNLIRDITFKYVKFYYDKKIDELNKKHMSSDDIKSFVDKMYDEKKQSLKDYIRNSLKKIYSDANDEYPLVAVENIISEMSDDINFTKERVINEIENYQKTRYD